MKGLSPENDDYQDEPEESFISIENDPSLEALFQEQSSDTLPTTSTMTEQQNLTNKKETKRLNKQVSWSDTQDKKNRSSDSGSESSDEEDSLPNSKSVCDKCSSKTACCNCDSGVALDDQVEVNVKDSKTESDADEMKGNEKDVESGKFDGVFSDTDDSEGSVERYKSERAIRTYSESSVETLW